MDFVFLVSMDGADMDSVGSRIKSAREAKGWTQADLAASLGMGDRSMVSRWETDEAIPRGSTRLKIANALDVENEWIRTGTGPREDKSVEGVDYLMFDTPEGQELTLEEYLGPSAIIAAKSLKERGIDLEPDTFARVALRITLKCMKERRSPTEGDVAKALMQLWK
ncbi:helix-turn-helix transcriptional regulator [Geothrix sp. 21YS21S-2]|uniref:helix-turn-helix domain-containing protein n=1 Tax=Geothrix sp. 21YS21S-2 TaxID=3068893 RepID=UPI0027B9B071|nr:helix-turn-helix transcriptional regulator [Geothrix sp. 21YS21S-2]